MSYRKFNLDKEVYKRLSEEDKKILRLLEVAVKQVAVLYEQQKEDGFYSPKLTKEQIEKAAEKNPDLLSPFSFVYEEGGQLKVLPCHQKYATYLQPIAENIQKAARISTNQSFKRYLLLRAESILNGNYKEADIAWFKVKNSNIDFSVGLFERYLDTTLFIKRAYQAHVGIIDAKYTELAEQIRETLYSSAKMSYSEEHSADIAQKGVEVYVERTPATSGYMADVLFSGEHFPSDLDIMKQYGSKIIIYKSQLKLKFEKLHYPIFKSLFEKRFALKYPKDLLLKAMAWNILLYELGRQLHKYIGARERLKELYGPIDEANGFASGIQHAKHLVVKGLLSQDELEAIIIIHIVWMFADWLSYKGGKDMESYVRGNAIDLNFYLKNGALKEKEGISWPNFSKIFFEIEELATILVQLLRKGTYKEAEKFVKENANLQNFERLGKNLESIKPII